jgi:hypothetical protein
MMRWTAALVLSMLLAPATVLAADRGSPTDLHDGWTVAAPDQEGLDPALICGIGPRLEALTEAKAHGVIIARHGLLVYERYFAGKDWRLSMSLGDVSFDAGTKHDIRSISKSVTSLLVGIALDRGLLTDLVLANCREMGAARSEDQIRPRPGERGSIRSADAASADHSDAHPFLHLSRSVEAL